MPSECVLITNEAQWLELRRAGLVNASEVAALYGVHPFMTVAELVAEKRELLPPKEETVLMRRGKDLESTCAQKVREQREHWLITKSHDFWFDRQLRMGATPDFYISDGEGGESALRRGILETKVVTASQFVREWTDTLPPIYYLLQLQQQMLLADVDFGAIGALVIGEHVWECHVYEVPRHQAAEQRLIELVKQFWDGYNAGKIPEFDFDRDRAAIRALYPTHVPGRHLVLSHDNRLYELLQLKQQLETEIDSAAKAKVAVDNEITAKLGDAETAECGNWKLSYKLQKRREYTVAATAYRVLRTKGDVHGNDS